MIKGNILLIEQYNEQYYNNILLVLISYEKTSIL